MRIRRWLKAALPPALALSVILAGPGRLPLAAQAGANEQTMYVSAVDKDGTPVQGLGPEAFVVTENGARREILRVSHAVEPIDITVLIDNSTAAHDAITYLRKALPPFIASLTPANPMALVTLADRPTLLVKSTTSTSTLTKRAQALQEQPSSGATLLDGLYEISDGLKSRDAARAAIVAIFTDGVEFSNRYSKDVVQNLKRAGASAHLVTIGRFPHSDSEPAIRERSFLLTEAPPATGGAIYTMLVPNVIDQKLEQVSQDLRSQYKVVYNRPERTIAPDSVEISSSREGIKMRGTPARTKSTKKGS